MAQKRKIISLLYLLGLSCLLHAANSTVYLEHSDRLSFDKDRKGDCQILTGNVRFRHEGAFLDCDSAFFYDQRNYIEAFGHIKMNQGDTLYVYGDKLRYNGDIKLAMLRGNVRMENRKATLYTDSLNYDRASGVGYYFHGGRLVDETNQLTSIQGQYYPDHRTAIFREQVKLTNARFNLYSDTLKYNTYSRIAYLEGPSNIYYDSTRIYTEKGWYHTVNENGELLYNSCIYDKEGRTLTGDTIYYSRPDSLTRALSNVVLRDSAQQLLLTGHYGLYNDRQKQGQITKRATLINFASQDSLFLTADTLFYNTIDTLSTVKGYHNVQAWQIDFQGVGDSVFFSSADSILRLFGLPVIWYNRNQITGDSVLLHLKNNQADRFWVEGDAFVFMQSDSSCYNQLSGKKITGYISNSKLQKVLIEGNALSLYFPEDDANNPKRSENDPLPNSLNYVGINRAESSTLTVYLDENNRPRRILMTPQSNGVMHTPGEKNDSSVSFLKGFFNYQALRPSSKEDIYHPKDKKSLVENQSTKPKRKHHERWLFGLQIIETLNAGINRLLRNLIILQLSVQIFFVRHHINQTVSR